MVTQRAIAGTDSDDSIFGYAGSDILIGGAGKPSGFPVRQPV
jgi:Ca2+-binding RTX toxin-like protein